MTDQFSYPTLRLGVLQSMLHLREKIEAEKDCLRGPSCPYDLETIELLEKIFAPRIVEVVKEVGGGGGSSRGRGRPKKDQTVSGEDAEEVEETAKELLKQLKELGEGEKALDTASKIQIIKAKASLTEQLIKMRERIMNVKRLATFQSVVISVLDELVDEDGRQEFLKKIEPYRD